MAHFPIVLLILGFVVDLVYLKFRHPGLRAAGLLLLIGGLIGAIAAVLTGVVVKQNAELVLPSLTDFTIHAALGFALLVIVGALAIARVWILVASKSPIILPQVIVGVVAIGLILAVGFYGGRLVYDRGIGVAEGGIYYEIAQEVVELERIRAVTPNAVERGAEAYRRLGCSACHGEQAEGGRGGDLKARKVQEEFYETHGSRNFPPEIVTQEIVDDIGAWLERVRPSSGQDDED